MENEKIEMQDVLEVIETEDKVQEETLKELSNNKGEEVEENE